MLSPVIPGAARDQPMESGASLLFIASQLGHVDVVQVLLAAGAAIGVLRSVLAEMKCIYGQRCRAFTYSYDLRMLQSVIVGQRDEASRGQRCGVLTYYQMLSPTNGTISACRAK